MITKKIPWQGLWTKSDTYSCLTTWAYLPADITATNNKLKFKSQDLNGLFFCKQSSSSRDIIFSVLIMQSLHNQRIAPWKHCGCSSCSTTTRGSDLWTTLGRSREQGGVGSLNILSHCIRDKGKQGGITCGAIDEPRKSSKAIDKRVIINFRDKNDIARIATKMKFLFELF